MDNAPYFLIVVCDGLRLQLAVSQWRAFLSLKESDFVFAVAVDVKVWEPISERNLSAPQAVGGRAFFLATETTG